MSHPVRNPSSRSMLKRYIRPLLFIAGLGFFLVMAYSSWNVTKELLTRVKWPLLWVSILLGIADHCVVSIVFRKLLNKHSIEVPLRDFIMMYFFGQMSKYIPGRLWGVFYQRTYVQKSDTTSSLFIINIELLSIFMLRSITIAVTILLFEVNAFLAVFVFLCGMTVFGAAIYSDIIPRFVGWIANHTKIKYRYIPSVAPKNTIKWQIVITLISTVTFLSSNVLFLNSTLNMQFSESLTYIAYFSIALVVGVLAIVMPAGMGVREFVFISLTNYSGVTLSMETLTAIAVLYRYWHMSLEFLGMLLARIISLFPEAKK